MVPVLSLFFYTSNLFPGRWRLGGLTTTQLTLWSIVQEALATLSRCDPPSGCFHEPFHPYTTQRPLTSYKPASVKASVCQATSISPRLRCGRTCSYSFNPPVRFHVRSAESTGRLHRPNGVLSCSPCGEHLAPYVDVCRAAPALL